jgi:hypothetical protein
MSSGSLEGGPRVLRVSLDLLGDASSFEATVEKSVPLECAGMVRLADDLAEEPHQRLWRRDVRTVAGGDFEVAPGRIGFETP